jgi:hypothetical protein
MDGSSIYASLKWIGKEKLKIIGIINSMSYCAKT